VGKQVKPYVVFTVFKIEYLSDGSCRDPSKNIPTVRRWKVKNGKVIIVRIPNLAEDVAHHYVQEAYCRSLAKLITGDL